MAKKIRLINRSTGFDSEKEKEVRLINPSTGFDSRSPSTYGRDYEAEQKKETERANAKLAVRRAPKALSSRGSAGITQMADRGMGNMSNLGRARNFEEYMQLRKEEEEAQGMQRAAEKLLAQNNTGTDVMFGKTDREREEEAQAAADLREMQYGYKRLGDKAVFATPFSPMPAEYKTKAQVPSAFGISDQEYVEALRDVDRYKTSEDETDEESLSFLNRYFGGNIPTDDEYNDAYERLYNDMSVPDEEVRDFFEYGPALVERAMEAQSKKQEKRVGYDAALEMLGPDALEKAGRSEAEYLADYYGQKLYGRTLNEEDAPYQEMEGPLALTQEQLERVYANPFAYKTQDEKQDLMRWGEMTEDEQDTYQQIQRMYGEEAAQKYMNAMEEVLNQRQTEETVADAQTFASEHPFLASMIAPAERLTGAASYGVTRAKEILTGQPADEYDLSRLPTRTADTLVGSVAQNIEEGVGGFGGKALGFGYQTLMSLADMGANMLTFGPAGALSVSGGMGMSAASSGYNSAIDAGADHDTANAMAAVSGIAELVFEKFSIENLLGMASGGSLKGAVLNVMRQMGIDASEEAATEVANQIGEYVLLGDKSTYAQEGAAGAAREVGLAALGGLLMGGVSGGMQQGAKAIGEWDARRGLQEAAQELAKEEKANATEPAAPVQTPSIQEESKKASEAAQEGQRQAQTAEVKEEQSQKEKPSIGAENAEIKGEAFKSAKTATYAADGQEGKLRVLGIASVSRDGRVMLEAETESGERELVNAADVTYDDAVTDELMAYGASERMDARGLRSYLEGYDQSMATAEEYANAFSSIYSRARSGMDFEQAALGNSVRSVMTQDAMIAAYMAGEAQYMTENNVLNAKEQKFQKKMLNVLNRYAGGKITLTKQDIGGNALYNRQTGEILISTNAQRGAYAYYAVHELGHKLKAENAQQWTAFQELVMDALDRNGVDVSELMKHEAEKFEQNGMQYDDDLLLEEVICNNAAGILQDEAVVRELIQKDRSLMERVADWLREFIDKMSRAMQDAGRDMSELGSWQGLQALKDDHESLKAIYESLMEGLEQANAQQNSEAVDARTVKASLREDLTTTPAFQRWFGNSQIVNEDGSPKVMYRGGGEEINVFDRKKSKASNLYGRGFYFTDSETHAKQYGDARSYYLRIENPLSAESGAKNITQKQMRAFLKAVAEDEDYGLDNYGYGASVDSVLKELKGRADFDALQDINATAIGDFVAAIELFNEVNGTNYDGIITPTETVVFDSRQIKSATDNVGTFDPSNPDIRYSLRETDDNIQNALAAEEKAMMHVKAHRITAMEADKLAGKALQKANSDYDRQEVASRIARTIDLMERGEDVDMRQVDDEMTQLAADIMTKSRTLDLEHEERAKPVRDYLRTTAIRLTEGQRAEAESMSGSYGAYRKSMFGRVRLSGRGMMLDQAWQELNALDAEWFPADAREGDMPALLMAAVDESKPVYHNGMGMNVEESANWLAGQIMQAYFHLPAVQAAAKNARTFGDSVRDLVKAMKSFEETSWSEYQNSLQAIKDARAKQMLSKREQEIAAQKAKYKIWKEESKEKEIKRKVRGRIEAKTGSLLNWLEKPTETRHIPAAVEDSVRELLKTLDFTGKDTKVATELARRLEGIAKSMETAQNNEEGTMYFEQDQQMIDEIKTLAEKIGLTTDRQQMEGRGIYDLNSEELKDLDKWLGVIKHVLTDAGKLKGTDLAEYNSLDEVQGLSVMEIRQKTPLKDKRKALKAWEKYFGPDMMDSFTFFERLGPTATRVFMGLRSGFDENVRLLAIAEEYSKTLFAELKMEELTGKKAKKEKLKLSDGTEVEMTKGEMMSIYVLSRRKQARGHMYKEEKGEGIKLASDEDPDPHVLTKADEEKIAGKLTEQEKRVAEGMQRFLSRECAGWGNAASMKLLGYRKFGEEYYWPIRTDSSTHNSSRLEQNFDADINAVIHQGMTKQTVENANNAIVIEDAFDTFTRHISNMAAYSAYAVPMSDFNKWYGNTELKRSILKAMGPKGQEYIKNLIIAINGSRRAEERSGVERLMAGLNRNAKAASVGANARVVVQQPTSYARAAAYMNPKYLSGALAMKKPDDALMYRYCPITRWKDWGFRETNVGPNLKELLTGKKTGMAWLQDKSMALAAKGDMWTMRRLWCACELETKALYGYKEGSEAYYRQVGKRMSELMDRTQVVDSVFHRSQMMRSKSWLAQTLTNFMSEPTKTFNLLVSATYEWAENRKNKAARARLARTYGVWVATAALTSAAAALVDAFRDDEDEKDWLEKYVSAFWDNTLESLRPSGMLPGVKEVLSIVQGYSPSRMDLQSVQRVMWAIDAVKKYIQGEGTQNLYGVVYKVAQAGSSFTGVPLSNVMRDINGVIQTYAGTSLTLKESSSEKRRQRVGMIYDALLEKDKATAQKQREALKNKGGATDKEIDTMLDEFLLDNPKVKEAWEAKASGRIADANRARNALTVMGFPGEVVDKAVQRYGNKAAPKETKEKDPNEQLNVKLYTSTDAKNTVSMILNGTASEADLREIMSELAADSTAKDPQDSVRKSVQSALKEEYITLFKKGDAKARRMELILLNVVGTSQKTIDNWKKEAKGK